MSTTDHPTWTTTASPRRASWTQSGSARRTLGALLAFVVLLGACSGGDDDSADQGAEDADVAAGGDAGVGADAAGDSTGAPTVDASTVTGLSVVAELAVGASPWTAVVVDDLAWIPHQGGITAVDASLTPVHQLELAGHPETPLWWDDRLWFADIAEPVVTIVDPTQPTAFFQAPVGRQGITPVAAKGAVWVPNRADGTVSRVAPDTLETLTIPGLEGLTGLLVADDEVYTVIDTTIWHVSAEGGPVKVGALPPAPPLDAFGASWAVEGDELAVTGGPVERVVIGSPIVEVAATDDSVIVVAQSGILRIDPEVGVITGGIDVQARQPLVGATGVWFVAGEAGEQTTIGYADGQSLERFDIVVDGVPDHFALLDGTLIVSLKRGDEVVAITADGA